MVMVLVTSFNQRTLSGGFGIESNAAPRMGTYTMAGLDTMGAFSTLLSIAFLTALAATFP